MPLPWFRRRARRPETESTRETPPEQKETGRPATAVAEPDTPSAEGQEAARRRRRRGNRGGKGRKRTTTSKAAETAAAEKPEAKAISKARAKSDEPAAKPARPGNRAPWPMETNRQRVAVAGPAAGKPAVSAATAYSWLRPSCHG